MLLIAAGLFFVPGVREWVSGAPADAQLAADTTARGEAAPEMTTDTPPMQSEQPTLQMPMRRSPVRRRWIRPQLVPRQPINMRFLRRHRSKIPKPPIQHPRCRR